jgi:hypothetical protein
MPAGATLSGKFTVTNKTNPSDTATDTEDRDIKINTTWLPMAQAELAKINFTSVLINIPLEENEKAKEAAIAEVKLVMEGKVSEEYTIDFVATGYENKILSGTFTVTSKGYPLLDTSAESRDITVDTSWLPTAQRELDKIDVPSVSILVSLLHNDSRGQAVNQAVSQARAQVLEGYSVSFEWTDYSVKGTLSGKFTVTNDAYPFDTATGDEKIITVSYTPNALGELGKICMSQVPVSVPTNTAQEQALTRAVAIAQKQVSPGYNVTYKSGLYFSIMPNHTTAAMGGKFTVTSATDPGDRAEDNADRTMSAVFTTAELEADSIKVSFAPHGSSYSIIQIVPMGALYYAAQAQEQVTQGYTVFINSVAVTDDSCMLSFTNDNDPEDTVTRYTELPLVRLMDPPAANAELEKIKIEETINIDVPLSREAINVALPLVVGAAQAQVAPGYTVFVEVADNLININHHFVIRLVVSNDNMPTDIVEKSSFYDIEVIYTPPTASSELVKISVPSVTVTLPPGHDSAQTAAVEWAELAARAQIQSEYTVVFVPTSYSDGILSGKFTISNAGDSATDDIVRMVTVNYALSTAADELAKINVPIMSVTVPLDAGGAADEAVAAVMLAAQKQVTPGYAVTFSREGSSIAGGTLSGRFTVTNGSDPSDTAEDATNRTIEIRYRSASEVFGEIDVPFVTIDIPLGLPIISRNAIVSRIFESAQAQVPPGYTATFMPTFYYDHGEILGHFVVTNDNNPADTTEGTRTLQILAGSTYVRDAKDEFVRINVPSVNVSMLLDDPGALDAAVSAAEAGAQRMIIAGFTAKFTPTGKIADNGTLTGRFTVTNNDFPIDTATDKTERTVTLNTPAMKVYYAINSYFNDDLVWNSMPLDAAGAVEAAVSAIEAEAYLEAGDECTISFAPTGNIVINEKDPRYGTLTGRFTVTNKTYPDDDMAMDKADRTIRLIHDKYNV